MQKRWGVSRLFVQNFWSHSTKNFAGEHFGVSENFGYRKMLCITEGGITFLRKLFVTQYQKISLWNTSVYQKISGIEKCYALQRGVPRFSVENFLSYSTKKFRCGTLRCFRKFRVSQNFMHKKRISLNSVENFLSQCRTIS